MCPSLIHTHKLQEQVVANLSSSGTNGAIHGADNSHVFKFGNDATPNAGITAKTISTRSLEFKQ